MTRNFSSAADRDAVEAEAPWAGIERPATVHALLSRTRARFPDRPALSFQMTSGPKDPAETLSWTDLHRRTTQAANLFRRLGIHEGDTVAYVLPNCTETATVLLGGMTAGIVAPINPLLEPSTIAALLRETGAKVVVTLRAMPRTDVAQKVAEAVAYAPEVRCVLEIDLNRYLRPPKSWIVPLIRPRVAIHHTARVLNFNAEAAREPADRLSFDAPQADRVAALFHTGGTTGLPKLARHRFSGMIYNGWVGHRLMFNERDVLICPLPLFHVFAAYPILMSALTSGAHVVLPTPQGYRGDGVFDNFWKLIERWGVTFLITVPTALSALMQRKIDADVSTLETAISGSATLPRELYNRFEAATGVQIAEGYGLTEATCLVSCNPPSGMKKLGSVGIPFPHTRVRILHFDEAGCARECATDEVGEICIDNPGVWPGQTYADASRNAGLFAGDYLRTGDLGRLDGDGYLWITGRAKDTIVRAGHNIDPAVIEEALLSHDAVAFAGAIGQPDRVAGELPCAYVELVTGATVRPAALLEHIRGRIGERAAIPRHIEVLDTLPKTAVGKIFKPDLRRRAIARVFDAAFAEAKLPVRVAEVAEHPRRGLVARLSRTGTVEETVVAELMGSYTTPWEWVEGSDR
ncbi:acyl-CoA synthetase [Rhodobaculum claviforme]|uniref:Acyl-CoA synthetase n=1 Tax=Rhodobaculum claviforme TaxID=1549854 RepID=A0A934TLN5_9RHOB|nr:acyl-CoA synthetase [Rhodobaculum claviforme]MBK5927303.1 acyl-CoA synthetase [Rhodobaculum claviforme]